MSTITKSSQGTWQKSDPRVNTTPLDVANQLRALKIVAGLIETKNASWAYEVMEFLPSNEDDALINRARRMSRIQQKAREDFSDAGIVPESTSSSIERLQAAARAYRTCKDFRDVIHENCDQHTIFLTDYLWGYEMFWGLGDSRLEIETEEPSLDTQEKRWKALTWCLRGETKVNMKLRDVAEQDYQRAGDLLNTKVHAEAVERIFQHPEYANFLADRSGGLIVHAYDEEYRKKSQEQSKGLRAVWKGRNPTSIVTGFGHRFVRDFSGPGPALLHVAGFCNSHRPEGSQEHNLHGSIGLFRSLINQLIAHRACMKSLSLMCVVPERLEDLRVKRPTRETLFELFHDLITEVADLTEKRDWPAQEIAVVIDGIDWIEGGWPIRTFGSDGSESHEPASNEAWNDVVDFFRALADECNSSDLGQKVHFRYILLHPLTSKIGAQPSVLERYITLDKEL